MEDPSTIFFPLIPADRKNTKNDCSGKSYRNTLNSSMPNLALVPNALANGNSQPNPTSLEINNSNQTSKEFLSTNRIQIYSTRVLLNLRNKLETESLSRKAAELIINAPVVGT